MTSSHIPWPSKVPSKLQINNISQIDFSVEDNSSITPDLLAIFAYNNQASAHGENPYLWRSMPKKYENFLRRIFFHLELLKLGVNKGEGEKEHLAEAKKNLLHTDHLLDAIFLDALEALSKNKMDADRTSLILERWMTVEWYIQKHADFDIQAFEEEEEGNAQKLREDPFQLGKRSSAGMHNTHPFLYSDWSQYDQSASKWLSGHEWDWNFKDMVADCNEELVAKYTVAYLGRDNEEVGKILTELTAGK